MDPALQRACASNRKGDALKQKSHYARAAETFELAAAQAREAVNVSDLIVAYCMLQRVRALVATTSTQPGTAANDKAAAMRTCVGVLLNDVLPVLRRRAAAGTLLCSACRADEAEWYAAIIVKPEAPDSYVRQAAQLFGYSAFISAAFVSTTLIMQRYHPQLRAFTEEALELMTRPRALLRRSHVEGEMSLVNLLSIFLRPSSALDAALAPARPAFEPLAAAWARLESSGVLLERGIAADADSFKQGGAAHAERSAAAHASWVARGGRLRPCALPACAAVEQHQSHFKLCSACKAVVYCCQAHQAEDWPSHKKACKAARKAAEKNAS